MRQLMCIFGHIADAESGAMSKVRNKMTSCIKTKNTCMLVLYCLNLSQVLDYCNGFYTHSGGCSHSEGPDRGLIMPVVEWREVPELL